MTDKNIIMSVAGLLLVVGVVLYFISGGGGVPTPPVTASSSPVAAFAQCLKDKGVVFYGAFWCSHCKAQKALFGSAEALLSYVECSTPNGNAQTQICIDKKIDGYPTWEFSDGSRLNGEQTFAQLAEKSQCSVPVTE